MSRRRRHVVIDGSNVATEGRSLPSLAQLREAIDAFTHERPKDQLTVVVDATFGHRISKSERTAFNKAVDGGEIVVPPAGAVGRGDGFILQIADKAGAVVLSNDSFQEFHGDHAWLFEEGRLLGAKPIDGIGWVFVERVPVRGPISRRAERMSNRSRKRETSGPEESGSEAKKSPARKSTKKSTDSSASRSSSRSTRGTKTQGRADGKSAADKKSKTNSKQSESNDSERSAAKKSGGRSGKTREPDKLNNKAKFVGFIAVNSIGDVVEGEVTQFSSHGCYLTVAGATCYLPVKAMGSPTPTKARDVVRLGDVIRVKVESLDSDRRGINVSLVEAPIALSSRSSADAKGSTRRRTSSSNSRSRKRGGGEKQATNMRSTEIVATKTTKKSSAKKAAKKAPAKKAAKKVAKKAPAKKATAKKAAKKAPAKKATAKKAAKKAPAKKAAAKKATKKAPAKKAPSAGLKKRTSPAKKAGAKRQAKAKTSSQAKKGRR